MKKIGLGFAYLCIYTTPIQLGFIAWQIFIITFSEYSILSMSTKDFLVDNIRLLHDWIYSWFWNDLLDFVYQFPALMLVEFFWAESSNTDDAVKKSVALRNVEHLVTQG